MAVGGVRCEACRTNQNAEFYRGYHGGQQERKRPLDQSVVRGVFLVAYGENHLGFESGRCLIVWRGSADDLENEGRYFSPVDRGCHFTAESSDVLLQALKDQLRGCSLCRNVGNHSHQQPGGMWGGLDRRHMKASQQVVRRIARKHPVQCLGNLPTQLPGLTALLAPVTTILAFVTRILAVIVTDFGTLLEQYLTQSFIGLHICFQEWEDVGAHGACRPWNSSYTGKTREPGVGPASRRAIPDARSGSTAQ
jgi:hypothetical protein